MLNLTPSEQHAAARCAPLQPHELLELAHAAEYMAAESEPRDRGGRCAAYLYTAARRARAAAGEEPTDVR